MSISHSAKPQGLQYLAFVTNCSRPCFATTAHASLPPAGGLTASLLSEKEYLDQIAPDQLSNLIDILNVSAEAKK